MKLGQIHSVYFVGIGGIGMSAIARWFAVQGKTVGGYDRVATPLTKALEQEGIGIHYEDDLKLVNDLFKSTPEKTLIVYTPAIPADHSELRFFKENGFNVMKRSEVLGIITKDLFTIGVAGTHGKTTTSSMIAHILHETGYGCNAFIGGIMTNYESNLIVGRSTDVVVVEADEFDRSFLRLFPNLTVVTSVDPDHLDIYGNKEEMIKSFNEYVNKTGQDGKVILNEKVKSHFNLKDGVSRITYGKDEGEITVSDLKIHDGVFEFDYQSKKLTIKGIELQVPGFHNMENCVAAITVALTLGISQEAIKEAVKSYSGVKRRFEYILKNEKMIFIDDYAHHPGEIQAFISSVRALYPNRQLTAIFQPHLFSRTQDFALEFAEELSKVDDLILLDIYPAREEPIPGVTSQIIYDEVSLDQKILISKDKILETIQNKDIELIVTIGAGDIDREIPALKAYLEGKEANHV